MGGTTSTPTMTPPAIDGFNIVFSDTFPGAAGSLPNANSWNIINAGPNFGNNEVQTYTSNPSNVSVSGNNTLQIQPQKDSSTGAWTSARLESKASFACPAGGRMILQASLQTGTAAQSSQAGIWPAFWALGASIRTGTSWPQCGEWDIMENAHGVAWTLASLHYGPDANQANERSVRGGVGSAAQTSFAAGQYNTYTLTVDLTSTNWQAQTLTWALNGKTWFTVKGSDVGDQTMWANCAQKPYYTILNVAIGSNFPQVGGKPDAQTVTGLGSGMQVQYVAFYISTGGGQKKGKEGGNIGRGGREGSGGGGGGVVGGPPGKDDGAQKPVGSGVGTGAVAERSGGGTEGKDGESGKKRNSISRIIHKIFD